MKGKENWSWAVKEIADRLDGKPHQSMMTEVSEKRDVRDWTTDELIAFLNESREGDESAAQAEDGKPVSDSVQ